MRWAGVKLMPVRCAPSFLRFHETLTKSGVQIRQQRVHLLLGKAAGEAGHHAPTLEHIARHGSVRRRNPAGQRLAVKKSVQVRRNVLQRQVVVLVAMSTPNLVEMLPFCLLQGKVGSWPASPRFIPAAIPMNKTVRPACLPILLTPICCERWRRQSRSSMDHLSNRIRSAGQPKASSASTAPPMSIVFCAICRPPIRL